MLDDIVKYRANFSVQPSGRARLYRVFDYRTCAVGDDYLMGPVSTHLRVEEYEILSYTATGAWIYDWVKGKRFVNLRAKKQFACASVEEAKIAFTARKQRQIAILSAQLESAKEALALMQK